jgi:hypothetical protein
MQGAENPHDWVDYANALSTVAVALFAFAELHRGRRERDRRSRVARAKVLTLATRVELHVVEWTADTAYLRVVGDPGTVGIEAPRAWVKRVAHQSEGVERAMEELVEVALDAPERVSLAIHKAAEQLASGLWKARVLDHDLRLGETGMVGLFDREAWEAFSMCQTYLGEAHAHAREPGLRWRRPLAKWFITPYRALLGRLQERARRITGGPGHP